MADVVDPITDAGTWNVILVGGANGTPNPGVIAVNGIRGFDRQTAWDKKIAKGQKGATLTKTLFPPAEGTIEFILWTKAQFAEWAAFRALLNYESTANANAIDVYHPSLSDLKILKLVVKKISPIRHMGHGKYSVTIDFIEWIDPPKTSVVKTTNKSEPDSSKTRAKKPDPNQDKIDQLNSEIANYQRTKQGF